MALTLDGFLPHEDEMLMRWVRENKRYGFPRWQRQATFHIYPHYGLMDLLNVKEKHDKDCIYLAGVGDGGSAEYADGLFRYNLVDETVLFLLPLSYGGGIPLTGEFRSAPGNFLAAKLSPTESAGLCINETDEDAISTHTFPFSCIASDGSSPTFSPHD